VCEIAQTVLPGLNDSSELPDRSCMIFGVEPRWLCRIPGRISLEKTIMKSIEGQIGAGIPIREFLRLSTSLDVRIVGFRREFQVYAATERAGPAFWGLE
jgi:hypothetical protein